ncbi:MAG: LCP family protein [Chloroflexota bacterium]
MNNHAKPTPPPKTPAPRPKLERKVLLRILLAVILASVLCASGFSSYALVRYAALRLPGAGSLFEPSIRAGTTTPGLNPLGTPLATGETGAAAPVVIAPSQHPWDGAGRVTVLLLGLDYRDWAADEGPSRSDTMLLLTLDPLTKSAGMLSIPRDLWVAIPGFQHGKINTAYYLGDAYKLPGGGPALAVQTVEQLLGVPINYYAQIDFGAFVRFIDEIGGVKIDVPYKVKIDLPGAGLETKKVLKPGVQVLPGEWALAYARNRYTEGGDFDRAARQQQVVMAIRERLLSPDALPTLISKAPTLYNELASGVNTNLTLDEVIQLALLAQNVPDENIHQAIIGTDSVLFGKSPDGLDILIPIPDKIHVMRDQVFTGASGLGPETPGDALARLQAENAKLAIFNGSHTPNLLERSVEYLRSLGANIQQSAEAGQSYTSTTIIDHTGNPHTLKYLVDLMKISPSKIYVRFDPNSPVDIEVFLGDDWANQNTLP